MKVRIRARQTVFYDQTVEMSKEAWEKLKNAPDARLAEGWLDMSDIFDAEPIQEAEAETLVGPKSKKKPESVEWD